MPNDGSGANWDEASPVDSDSLEFEAMQVRDLRKGLRLRLQKEHEAPATLGAGGEHKAGSAKGYIGSAFPTKRPDLAVALGAADAGRVFWKYLGTAGFYCLTVFDGTGWRDLQLIPTNFPDGSVPREALSYGASPPMVTLEDLRAVGTEYGSLTAGSWQTRTLQTVAQGDGDLITNFSANSFELPPGTYRIEFWTVGYKCNRHQARLRNTTSNTTPLLGTTERADQTGSTTSKSQGYGEFTLSGSTNFELQHFCETTNAVNGGGIAANHGTSEIYSRIKIERVA